MEEGEQRIREIYQQKLKNKIRCKIAKGKALEQIADELEEYVEDIRPLYEELIKNQ